MRVYAVVNIDDFIGNFELTLISNPDDYETLDVVYAEIEGEVPTCFPSCDDLLEYWTPYNGEFEETVCGYITEDGQFVEDSESDCIFKISNYRLGKLVKERYEI